MIIQSSALQFQARQSRLVAEQAHERLELWSGPRRTERGSLPARTDTVADTSLHAVDQTRKREDKAQQDLPPALQTLARMIEAITGRPIQLTDGQPLDPEAAPIELGMGATGTAATPQRPAGEGWGLVYESTQTRVETESLRVQAQGEIRTADGRSLSFTLNLEMTSIQIDTRQTRLRAGDAVLKDPLVLHFEGPVGELRNTRFAFDLDADGQTDAVPFVGQGSGFLVLDRNRNGQVDNGQELFGARTGDGFGELAAYDDDGNGWIDEADAVFTQLQVWRMDGDGQTRLSSLAESGVGALALGRVGTNLSLRDGPGGQPLGQLRNTGLYLTEQGEARAMQQIDLVV